MRVLVDVAWLKAYTVKAQQGLALKAQGFWPLDLVGESAIYWFKRNTVQPVSVCEREKAR